MGQREVQSLLQLGVHHDIDIMVRSPSVERSKLARLYEDGATGVMIPLMNTADDVKSLVEKVKFPPIGNRGIDAAVRPLTLLLRSSFANRGSDTSI
jgi:4-hydroxy-2-oxoheptanedioate aldolase